MAAWQLLFLYAFGCNMASYYGLVLLVEKHGSKKLKNMAVKTWPETWQYKHARNMAVNMARNMAVNMARNNYITGVVLQLVITYIT